MENIGTFIKGIYRDVLKAGDGRIIYDSGWNSNAIVNRCRILLSGFMKNEATQGIQYLAVGQGQEQWDTTGAPAPDPAAADLINRHNPPIPLGELALVYLDENENELPISAGPTNRLQITSTLNPGYPPPIAPLKTYPLREFGLFGKFGTTDYMIDAIRHPVIHKDESATLIRVVRLFF